jgi:hypothetical protein
VLVSGTPGGAARPEYRLDIGNILGRTTSAWVQNLVPFTILGLVVYFPYLLFLALNAAAGSRGVGQVAFGVISGFAPRLFELALAGAVTYGVFEQLRNQRPEFSDVLAAGLRNIARVFIVGLLAGLAIVAGCCALVIPGLIVSCMLWVAVPVAVIERRGPLESLNRSYELTQGNLLPIFAVLLMLWAITFVVGAVLGIVIVAAHTLIAPLANQSISTLVTTLLLLPIETLGAVASAIGYHDLRVGREGADVEDLIRVFE